MSQPIFLVVLDEHNLKDCFAQSGCNLELGIVRRIDC